MTALVLLPGMDGTGRFLSEFTPALGPDIEPIVASYPLDTRLGYTELEQIARSFVPADRPFALLGESFSGPIAISIAATRPRNLRALFLCCTFARLPHTAPPALRSLLRWLPAVALPTAMASWLLLGRHATPRFRALLEEVLRDVPPQVLQARLHAVLDVDVTPALARLDVPVCYLRAAEDHVVPREAAETIKRHYPPTVIRDFAAPHGLLQTVPNEAATAIKQFLHMP